MSEIEKLKPMVEKLYNLSEIMTKLDFKNTDTNSFIAGARFAYENVLKLINEQIKENTNE